MRNKYPGVCYRCGIVVGVGEGHFERVTDSQREKWPQLNPSTKWLTQHAGCAIAWRGTDRHYAYNRIKKEDE